ncbi:hypothetical protein EHQ64_04325 [Leptospira sarikeiensis]|uniref:Cys-rich protein n=2 Tax=Leptospira sarikeiensis TaxID=2484943 RepID=A0A4R9KAT8_9LEPT|nr:hypothetical protein EHQ64_04325 [Leptospira sarikeiensis]
MKRLILSGALILLFAVSISAQPGPGQGERPHREDPCKSERQTYCKDARPGPETHNCLKENLSKLSETCKTHINDMIVRMEKVKAACAEDEEKYCKNVEQGRGHMRCLKENENKISAACKAALPPPPPRM